MTDKNEYIVYILEINGVQKLGIADSMYALRSEYDVPPWPLGFLHSQANKIAMYIYLKIDSLSNAATNLAKSLKKLASRQIALFGNSTPPTIKFVSGPMSLPVAKEYERDVKKQIDITYRSRSWENLYNEFHGERWSRITKRDIKELKRKFA